MNDSSISQLEYQALSDYITLQCQGRYPAVIAQEPWLIGDDFSHSARYRRMRKFDSVKPLAIEDLLAKQRDGGQVFREHFALEGPYVLLGRSELEPFLRPWDCDRFWQQFPDSIGLFMLTRVGFCEEQSQAMFHSRLLCGRRPDAGGPVMMKRTGERFEVMQRHVFVA